jgi:hypothetical protein
VKGDSREAVKGGSFEVKGDSCEGRQFFPVAFMYTSHERESDFDFSFSNLPTFVLNLVSISRRNTWSPTLVWHQRMQSMPDSQIAIELLVFSI